MCIGLKYSANTRRLPVLARTHSAQKNLPSITTSVHPVECVRARDRGWGGPTSSYGEIALPLSHSPVSSFHSEVAIVVNVCHTLNDKVWIHGGGFLTGDGRPESFGPQYLVKTSIQY